MHSPTVPVPLLRSHCYQSHCRWLRSDQGVESVHTHSHTIEYVGPVESPVSDWGLYTPVCGVTVISNLPAGFTACRSVDGHKWTDYGLIQTHRHNFSIRDSRFISPVQTFGFAVQNSWFLNTAQLFYLFQYSRVIFQYGTLFRFRCTRQLFFQYGTVCSLRNRTALTSDFAGTEMGVHFLVVH